MGLVVAKGSRSPTTVCCLDGELRLPGTVGDLLNGVDLYLLPGRVYRIGLSTQPAGVCKLRRKKQRIQARRRGGRGERDMRSCVVKLEKCGEAHPQVVHDRSTHPTDERGHTDAVIIPVDGDPIRDRSVSVPLIQFRV